MSGIGVSATVNDRPAQQLLNQVGRRFRDTTPVMAEIGEVLVLGTDQRFEREIDPDGVRWQENAPSTIERKRALGRILKILQETGGGRAGINYQVRRNGVEVGSPSKHMADHHLGRGQAERRWLPVTRQGQIPNTNGERTEVIRLLTDWVTLRRSP